MSSFPPVPCSPRQPNEISYNSAIHACGRGGQWELALSLLKEMRERGLPPDRITFGAMVSGQLRSGIALGEVEERCNFPEQVDTHLESKVEDQCRD